VKNKNNNVSKKNYKIKNQKTETNIFAKNVKKTKKQTKNKKAIF